MASNFKIDDFEILELIGKGSFSNVYKVKMKGTNYIYALKKVLIEDVSIKEKAYNEIKLVSKIKSKYVISFIDSFLDNNNNNILYILMEYAPYGDLEKMIKEQRKKNKYLDEKYILNIFEQIISGLIAIHSENILHRDLKAANIFIMNKEKNRIKIGDLNVSKIYDKKNNLKSTQIGTPYYASPEVWNNRPYDFKSDIWSIGCLFYEIATLKAPFEGKSLKEVYDKIEKCSIKPLPNIYSNNINKLIQMCLRFNDKLRPSAEELMDFLLRIKNLNNEKKNLKKSNKINIEVKNLERNKSEIRKRPETLNLNKSNIEEKIVTENQCNFKIIARDKSFNILNLENKKLKLNPLKINNNNFFKIKKNDLKKNKENINNILTENNNKINNKSLNLKKIEIKNNFKFKNKNKALINLKKNLLPKKTDILIINNNNIINKEYKLNNKKLEIHNNNLSHEIENLKNEITHDIIIFEKQVIKNSNKNNLPIITDNKNDSNLITDMKKSKSTINLKNKNNNSDNIWNIFNGWSIEEKNNILNSNKKNNINIFKINNPFLLNNEKIQRSITPNIHYKTNESKQMFHILNYQIVSKPKNLGKELKKQLYKKINSNEYKIKKLKNIKSKLKELLKNKNKKQ